MCFAGARQPKISIPLEGKVPVGRLPQNARRRTDLIGAEASLVTLLGWSFLASTLVPISSEAALVAVLLLHPDIVWPAIAVATLGNTLGSLTTYLIGRRTGSKKPLPHLERVTRYGSPLLALAWLPFVGDALCLAAGWARLNWVAVALWSAAGRFARYWVVAQGALW